MRVPPSNDPTHRAVAPQQVVITSHSWGENVVRNFFWWAERREAGWTEKHVAAYVNIAGTVLGVPKVGFVGLLCWSWSGVLRRVQLELILSVSERPSVCRHPLMLE